MPLLLSAFQPKITIMNLDGTATLPSNFTGLKVTASDGTETVVADVESTTSFSTPRVDAGEEYKIEFTLQNANCCKPAPDVTVAIHSDVPRANPASVSLTSLSKASSWTDVVWTRSPCKSSGSLRKRGCEQRNVHNGRHHAEHAIPWMRK